MRRLAVSFGKGLAFSFAVRLTGDAMRPTAAAQREHQSEKPPAVTGAAPTAQTQLDQRVIQAIVGAVEKRLNEHAARVQHRIAGVQSSVTANAARRIEQEMSALRAQVVAMQREFAQSLAAIVAEQTRAMEASVQSRIDTAVAPVRQQVQELRQRLAATDNTLGEFVSAMSETVRTASERGAEVEEPDPAAARETIPAAEPPRAVEPVPIRAHATPEHLDLRVLRKRLREVELPARETPPSYWPLATAPAPQRKEPASTPRLRAAS